MKKIYYIANIRIPTEKAHGIQIMKMCEAFAMQGLEVSLVVPRRLNPIKGDPFEYYRVKRNFKITKLPVLDLVRFGKIGFWIETLSFVKMAFLFSFFKKDSLFFTRDEVDAFFLSNIGKKVIWEGHMGHTNWFVRKIIERKLPMVMITNGLKNLYVSMGADPEKILVASDAVDFEQFKLSISKEEARKKVGLPADKKIVLYTGHLYSWKGADTVAQCAGYIKDDKTQIVFVGGTEVDIDRFKNSYGKNKNILILGKKPHHEMPLYMRSADILLLPNSAKEDISKLYTSPMKLFEYMASGTPIIASNLPSLKEILNDDIAYFFEPDDYKNLADTINRVLSDYGNSEKVGQRALIESEKYSWQNRAKNILNFAKTYV